MIKAFISHSSEQKAFALELVNRLGRDYCRIDCYNFESAYKSINEIYRAIEESTVLYFSFHVILWGLYGSKKK